VDPIVLERLAAEWGALLAGSCFRGAAEEPWGVRVFFGPPIGERGPTWALTARWPEPLWMWIEEAPLPKQRERLEHAFSYEGMRVLGVHPPAFDRRLRIDLAQGGARAVAFWEIEVWPPGNALLVHLERGVAWVMRRRAASTHRAGLGIGVAYPEPPPAFRKDPRTATPAEIAEDLGSALAAGAAREELAARLAHHYAGVIGPLAAHAAAAIRAGAAEAIDAETAAARLRAWASEAYLGEGGVLALRWTDAHKSTTLLARALPYVPPAGVEVLGPWPRWSEAARGLAAALPAAVTSEEIAGARVRLRRAERALEGISRDEREAARAAQTRRIAEALSAYLPQVPRRVERAEIPDPHDPDRLIVIELDPKLAPHENASQWFKRAAKLERALEILPARRRLLETERVRATALLRDLESGRRPAGAAEAPAGSLTPARPARSTLGPRPTSAADVPSKLRPRRYRTREGWEVWIGKSNEGNDYLSHRLARPEDYWFHVQGSPGSHVVLKRGKGKDEPSRETLREVAAWAAFFSRQRTSGTVPVTYTLKKYVRKPRGAKPGLAEIFRDSKTLFAKPAEPPGDAALQDEDDELREHAARDA
jgi:predicted ribosome quality control (RQC) complex YloA/Tae2 family protein